MKLTKTSAQAAMAMAYLSTRPGNLPTQARHVAEHLNVPTDSALKVLQTLTRRDLLQSQLGRRGGYRLHRPAREVTLLQIIEAIDGPITVEVPVQSEPRDETGYVVDLLKQVCGRSTRFLRRELADLTVADLAADAESPALLAAG
jgi:Rrf2 family protein